MPRLRDIRRVQAEPLWIRVERNRRKLALFIVGFVATLSGATVAFVIGMGSLLAWWARIWFDPSAHIGPRHPFYTAAVWFFDNLGTLAAAVGAVAAAMASLYVVVVLSRPLKKQLASIGASFVPLGELMATKNALKDMAIASGVDPAPELFVMDSRAVNGFLIARGKQRPICVVTTGLTEKLAPHEQRAVFANLMARLRAGDIMWATVVSAVMAPLWRWRDWGFEAGASEGQALGEYVAGDGRGMRYMSTRRSVQAEVPASTAARSGEALVLAVWALLAYMVAVIVSELLTFGHRKSQLLSSEVADAEGMLLLKDPKLMLRTLHKAIEMDNRINLALPMYAQLFYIWAGDEYVSDGDPEWERVERLREIVGIDGIEDAYEESRQMSSELKAARERVIAPPPPFAESDTIDPRPSASSEGVL